MRAFELRLLLRSLLLFMCIGIAAIDANAQTWFYQSYAKAGPTVPGYIALREEAGKSVLTMVVQGLNKCLQGALDSTVVVGATTTIITIGPRPGCEEVRFVIKNDGTGGQREIRTKGEWGWDGTNRGLTRFESNSEEALAADVAAAHRRLVAFRENRPLLSKGEVESLANGKKWVHVRLSDRQRIRWDLSTDGNLFGSSLTTSGTDRGTWSINEIGYLCVKWQGRSTDRCVAVFRDGEKLMLVDSNNLNGTYAELVIE